MASKATESATTACAAAAKPAADATPKADTAEDLRRRRAGIACFL